MTLQGLFESALSSLRQFAASFGAFQISLGGFDCQLIGGLLDSKEQVTLLNQSAFIEIGLL